MQKLTVKSVADFLVTVVHRMGIIVVDVSYVTLVTSYFSKYSVSQRKGRTESKYILTPPWNTRKQL